LVSGGGVAVKLVVHLAIPLGWYCNWSTCGIRSNIAGVLLFTMKLLLTPLNYAVAREKLISVDAPEKNMQYLGK
jgi:hypothetical protein